MDILLGLGWGILLVFNLYLLVRPQHVKNPLALIWCLRCLLLAFAIMPISMINRDAAQFASVICWLSTALAFIFTISTCGTRLLSNLTPPQKDAPPPQA